MASGVDPEVAIANITKGTDKKEDAMLMMVAHNKWDEIFLPAPMSICLLGELLMLSADRDISLREREPSGGFQYLKYPDSFRACLVQISNEGWSAFNQAHSSMDQIRMHTAGVETHVRNALKILLGGTLTEIEVVVPMSLNKVSEIANVCKDLAEKNERKFKEVMDLCDELLTTCTAAKGYYEESKRRTEREITRVSLEKELAEEWKIVFEAQLEMQEKEVKRAQDQFNKYMTDLPSTASIVGTHLAQGLIQAVPMAFSLIPFSNVLGSVKEAVFSNGEKAESKKYERETEDRTDSLFALIVISHIKEIGHFFKSDGTLNSKELADGIAQETQKILLSDQENLEQFDRKIKTLLGKIVSDAVSICQDVISHKKSMKSKSKEEKRMYKRYEALKKAACTLESHAKRDTSQLFSPEPSFCNGRTKARNTITEDVIENARFKTEMAKANLEQAQKKHDEMFSVLRQENEKLRKSIVRLKTLDIEKIDFDEIQRMLREGLEALANVRTQWGRLYQFFQMISNLIKATLKDSLTSFVGYAKSGIDIRMKGEIMSETYKEILISQATEANRITFVVQNISTAYLELSNEHLMPGISFLGGLIHLDPVRDREEMKTKRKEMQSMMESAQAYIMELLKKNKRDFDSRLNARINRIKTDVEAILPPLSSKKIAEIKKSVRDGVTKKRVEVEKKLNDLL